MLKNIYFIKTVIASGILYCLFGILSDFLRVKYSYEIDRLSLTILFILSFVYYFILLIIASNKDKLRLKKLEKLSKKRNLLNSNNV